MHKKYKASLLALLIIGLLVIIGWFLSSRNIAVLNPAGIVAQKERHLMITATLLMLVVVIPVFVLTFSFAWRYRESNQAAKYSPELDGSRIAEAIWWLIPSILILALSMVTWTATHELDPYKPLLSSKKPLTVQVVALDWKWLFMYPEQQIATVNYLQIPENTPVNFAITADAPMNSLWIPQLGGQVYAMPGMSTHLQLMASKAGKYYGESANISGKGFAGMHFMAHATTADQFKQWVKSVQQSPQALSNASYQTLSAPSENNPPAHYRLTGHDLYDTIMLKYMAPGQSSHMEME